MFSTVQLEKAEPKLSCGTLRDSVCVGMQVDFRRENVLVCVCTQGIIHVVGT